MRCSVLGLIMLWAISYAFGQAEPNNKLATFQFLPTRHMRLIDEATNQKTPVAKLRTFLEDTDLEVRAAAARALGTHGELADVPLLERAEQTAVPPSEGLTAVVRIAVARLQTRTDSMEKQVAVLLPFLQGQSQVIALEAVWALANLHHRNAVSALTSFARRQASDPQALAKVLAYLPTTVDVGLKDQLSRIEQAIQSYLPFANPNPITIEDHLACEIAYWRIRSSGMKPEEKIKLVRQEFNVSNIGSIFEGLLADEDQLPQLLPLLTRLLRNKTLDSACRYNLAYVLAKQYYPPAADVYLHILRDTQEPEKLRARALSMLAYHMHDSRVVTLSVEIIRQYREQKIPPRIARSAVDAIGELGLSDGMAKADIESLILPFLTEQWPFPLGAIKALRAVGTSRSVPQLLEIATNGVENLPDKYLKDSVRWDAMKALGHIGDTQAEPFLLSQLDNQNANYRIQAIQALTFMNSGLAIPRFADIVRTDKDDLTVRYAVSALCQLLGKAISPFFTELLARKISPAQKELFEEALLKVNPASLEGIDR